MTLQTYYDCNDFPSIPFSYSDNEEQLKISYKLSRASKLFGKFPSVLYNRKTLIEVYSSINQTRVYISEFFLFLDKIYKNFYSNESLLRRIKDNIKRKFMNQYLIPDVFQQYPGLEEKTDLILCNLIDSLTFTSIREGLLITKSKITNSLLTLKTKHLCPYAQYNSIIIPYIDKIRERGLKELDYQFNKNLRRLLEESSKIHILQNDFIRIYKNAFDDAFAAGTYNIKNLAQDEIIETTYNGKLEELKSSNEIRNFLYETFLDWGKVYVYLEAI